ncbi:MAG: hypothetical protein EP332_07815 [Bacteroidetes bacterium]|nr:MAG: hypothetical protein EP332_07815 [Bacteroidota bacterium]
MKWTKLLLLCSAFFFISQSATAQVEVQKGIEGKTFYDTAKTIIKEAYEYKLRYKVVINPRTGEEVYKANPQEIKNGLYILYREDGTIEKTGYFKNDVKCGVWKTFDTTGKTVLKEENLGGDCTAAN